jgi:hypothetical protein
LTVVEDTAERTLLWIPHGTVRKVPVTPPTRSDPPDVHSRTIASVEHRDWLLGQHVWDASSLWILAPVSQIAARQAARMVGGPVVCTVPSGRVSVRCRFGPSSMVQPSWWMLARVSGRWGGGRREPPHAAL